jgi:tetratricopeptide (TPR) repeat protein
MTFKLGVRTNLTDFDKRVGSAWSDHVRRKYDTAIAQFEKLIGEWGDHIDANYGLGLALKSSGQREKARKQFERAAKVVADEIAKQAADENSRLPMLANMIKQHIGDLS